MEKVISHHNIYLSYLMGAEEITGSELENLGITIEGRTETGNRKLIIPQRKLFEYQELVKAKMSNGFWNEVVNEDEILFIFKFKDGRIEEYKLSQENEGQISKLCSGVNDDPLEKTANVYKYISENDFYHDFMVKHYNDMINR